MFKKGNGLKRVAVLLIVCSFLLSAAAGFTGGILYSNQNSGSPRVASSADIPVINTGLSAYSTYSVAGVAKEAADSVVEIVTESVKTGSYMGQYISEGARNKRSRQNKGYSQKRQGL